MSIAKRQLKAAMNNIIKKELQGGSVPTIRDITRRINVFFEGKTLGQPIMTYRPATYRGISSSDDWNKTVDEIHTDLEALFEETIDQTDRILKDFDYLLTEKNKIERNINTVQDRIEELLLLNSNSDGYVYSVYDSFRDLSKINISETNCWIDLGLGQVTTMLNKTGNKKEDMTKYIPAISLETKDNIIRERVMESPIEMMNDNLNTCWLSEVVSSIEQDIVYKILIDTKIEEATRITIDPQTANAIEIKPSISSDMYSWTDLESKVCEELTSWDFSSTPIKAIKIMITKRSVDDTVPLESGDVGYVYYTGLKNISVTKIGFEDFGTITSIPLSVKDRQGRKVLINKISLEVEEETTPSSKIKYYVKVVGDDQWLPICHSSDPSPLYPKVIDLKKISSTTPIQNILSSNAKLYKNANGLNFYAILNENTLQLNKTLIIDPFGNMPKLYKGINQWAVESYTYKKPLADLPKITDWTNLPPGIDQSSIGVKYVDVDDSILVRDSGHTNSRYITNLYLTGEGSTTNISLTTDSEQELYTTVYVNQVEVFSGVVTVHSNNEVTIPLSGGWNSIQVLTYEHRDNPSQKRILFKRDIKSLAEKTRSQVDSMDIVSEFDLLYNVPERDTDKYAVIDNKVIVSEFLKDQNPRFEFFYKYHFKESINDILFKAELLKEDGADIPPKLLHYKLKITP